MNWALNRQMLALSAIALFAQAGFAQMALTIVDREAPVTPVPYSRILNSAKEPQNWFTYNGSYNSHRHSGLTQITPSNAKDLQLKWVFQSRTLDKMEVTPLVVDGVMYTVQGINDVVALEAATGKQIWMYRYRPDPSARNCCGQLTRGLAILDDKLYLAALDTNIIAIDAKTGKEVWKTQAADPKQKYSMTHAPLVIKDKVIAGVAGGEFGIRGFIAAWDAKTGKEAWKFYTVPGPGEPGNETWAGNSWEHGGAPIWITGSYDPDTNLTIWGTGNAGPDWDGAARLGDNLYSSSVIALDADTGKLKWHYQFSPHNEFDWDATQIPVLADVAIQGRSRKVVLMANRNGLFYAIDRTNGQFLYGKPFAKTNWYSGFDEKGRPMKIPGIEPSIAGTLVYPGNQGATNWYSPSYSPKTGLFYIPSWQNSSSIYKKGEEPPEFHADQTFAGIFPLNNTVQGDDKYASIYAADPKTGDKKWEFRLTAPSTDGGVLTTAGDMLFAGSRDGQFVGLDARDGKLVFETNLGPAVTAAPMSFSVNGKQYISIQGGTALYTFGLK